MPARPLKIAVSSRDRAFNLLRQAAHRVPCHHRFGQRVEHSGGTVEWRSGAGRNATAGFYEPAFTLRTAITERSDTAAQKFNRFGAARWRDAASD